MTLLLPLVAAGLIDADDLIIDAKSGVTGAGRSLKEQNLFAEVAEGLHPYGVAAHRHAPEIEQEIALKAGAPVTVSFTPHLVPMNRGELLSVYARTRNGAKAADLKRRFRRFMPMTHLSALLMMCLAHAMCAAPIFACWRPLMTG